MFQAGVRAHYVASVFAAPLMIERKAGLIVNISFIAAQKDDAGSIYGPAKAADYRMAACMAYELREHNLAVVSLYPGLVRAEGVMKAAEHFDLSNSDMHRKVRCSTIPAEPKETWSPATGRPSA
jgi:NAD(P)-dependent dehydrogenase (short-subunit alcohol dehydrogenase family)